MLHTLFCFFIPVSWIFFQMTYVWITWTLLKAAEYSTLDIWTQFPNYKMGATIFYRVIVHINKDYVRIPTHFLKRNI